MAVTSTGETSKRTRAAVLGVALAVAALALLSVNSVANRTVDRRARDVERRVDTFLKDHTADDIAGYLMPTRGPSVLAADNPELRGLAIQELASVDGGFAFDIEVSTWGRTRCVVASVGDDGYRVVKRRGSCPSSLQ